MSVPTHASEMIAWATFGLALEVCCPSENSFWVTVRRTESAGVLWDGDVIALVGCRIKFDEQRLLHDRSMHPMQPPVKRRASSSTVAEAAWLPWRRTRKVSR